MNRHWMLAFALAALLKGIAWSLWVPPGAFSRESAEYLALSRLDEPNLRGFVPKDLAILVPFSQSSSGRLPVRGETEARRLTEALGRGKETVFVGADIQEAAVCAYHSLLHRAWSVLAGVEIRWRWVLLRLANALAIVGAGLMTSWAVQRRVPHRDSVAPFAATLVMFGPSSGFGVLLGPSALVCLLWAGWLVAAASGRPLGAFWASLVALALSAVDPQGAAACAASGALSFLARSQAGERLSRIAALAGLCLSLVGLGAWAARIASGGLSTSPPGWAFGVFAQPFGSPPRVLLAAWAALALGAVLGAVRAPRTALLPVPLAGAVILSSALVLSGISPAATTLAIAPLLALPVALGWVGLLRNPALVASLTTAPLLLDVVTLFAFTVPRMYG